MFHILLIRPSLAKNEIVSFAGTINRAHGTCWARACACLTEIPVLLMINNYNNTNIIYLIEMDGD